MLEIGRSQGIPGFKGFQLDLRTAELRNPNGKTTHLSEQPLRILIALLERPGELVLREDLRKRLWPVDTMVEFEHRISAAMNRLRQVPLDSGKDDNCSELSPDGKSIASFRSADGPIYIYSTQGELLRELHVKGWSNLMNLAWAADSKGLFVAVGVRGRRDLLHVDLQGNAHVLWENLGGR